MSSTKVTVVYNGVKREILRRTLKDSEYFLDNYEKGKDFFWEGPYSQKCFSDFLQLLENLIYSEDKRNPNIIQLLEDWDCSDTIKNVISQVKSEFDHTIIHNGHQYQVNLRIFSTLSHYFCSQITSSPDAVVSVSDEYPEETFSLFLDCLHGIKSLPQDGRLVEIYLLSQNWECNSLLGLISTKETSFILSALSKGDIIDQKMIEENATHQILTLIQDPRFYHLQLSALSRIISKSGIHEEINNLFLFIQNLFEVHGIEAFFLIFSLDFSCCTEEIILKILETISKYSHSSLFLMLKNKILLQVERENECQKINQELNQKMKKEKAEDQQKIEELMKRLTELEKYQQEMDRKKKEEEEKRLQEEQDRKMREEDQRKREEKERMKEEEERKQKVEFERIGKWKSTKAPDFEGNIFEAAAKGKLTSIIYLLANGTNVNERFPKPDYDGWYMADCTPLHFSSRYGHLSVVEYLVSQKADINAQVHGIDFGTPLHWAVFYSHLSVVEYLVNQKADINSKDKGVEFSYFI